MQERKAPNTAAIQKLIQKQVAQTRQRAATVSAVAADILFRRRKLSLATFTLLLNSVRNTPLKRKMSVFALALASSTTLAYAVFAR